METEMYQNCQNIKNIFPLFVVIVVIVVSVVNFCIKFLSRNRILGLYETKLSSIKFSVALHWHHCHCVAAHHTNKLHRMNKQAKWNFQLWKYLFRISTITSCSMGNDWMINAGWKARVASVNQILNCYNNKSFLMGLWLWWS